ncbi:MAG: hypothetical protein HZA81_00830 [Candidatus Taylorbacteria bacterium]|nr:hypothetical protein [Candidatus Taylorbacteria bacterium]
MIPKNSLPAVKALFLKHAVASKFGAAAPRTESEEELKARIKKFYRTYDPTDVDEIYSQTSSFAAEVVPMAAGLIAQGHDPEAVMPRIRRLLVSALGDIPQADKIVCGLYFFADRHAN